MKSGSITGVMNGVMGSEARRGNGGDIDGRGPPTHAIGICIEMHALKAELVGWPLQHPLLSLRELMHAE